MIKAALAVLVLSNVYLFMQISREKKRNRIIQAFVSGIIDCLQKHSCAIERHDHNEKIAIENYEDYFKHFYHEIMRNIKASFEADFWVKPFKKWLANDRNLFWDNRYANDGFNMKYLDLVDMELLALAEEMKKDTEES